MFQRLLAIIHI